jgi:hypothetical protein
MPLKSLRIALKTKGKFAQLTRLEFTNCMETKEFCGAAWPSKSLKGKLGNS